MATSQLLAPIPNVTLGPGMIVRLEAINPTTGAAITGVKVQSITIAADDKAGAGLQLIPGAFSLVPGPDEGT